MPLTGNIDDVEFQALGRSGFSGALNDRLVAFFKTQGFNIWPTPAQYGTLVNFVNGPTQSLQDAIYRYWANGGGGGIISLPGIFNPLNFGAKEDGVTDDTTAIQNTIAAAAAAGGGSVLLQAPTVIGGQVTLSPHTGLIGTIPGPFDLNSTSFGALPMILVPNTAVSPIVMASRDSWLSDLGFYYPNQVTPTAATPTTYPAAINFPQNSAGNKAKRIFMANAFQGIVLQGGRHILEDLWLGCFNNCITVDFAHDRNHIRRLVANPFWDTIAALAYPQTIDTYVNNNKLLMNVLRADALVLEDIFGFSGNIGLQCADGTDAPAQSYGEGTNLRFDTFAIGLRVTSTQSPGWQINNYSCNASSAPVTLPAGGAVSPKVKIRGGSFWGAAQTPANVSAGRLDIKGVEGLNPAGTTKLAGGQPAVPANNTPLTNTTGVDCMVQVIGGTVTQIAVGGQNTGLTSGFFRVPANQTITLTYSVAPTWEWWGD